MAWPKGAIGAPNAPCITRARIKVSRLVASPHSKDAKVKPPTVASIIFRQPSRPASHAVIGVAIAVATRLSVITQEISSCVAERVPRIWGRTRLASVIVMLNSMLDSCTMKTISHCWPVRERIPPRLGSTASTSVLKAIPRCLSPCS